MGLNRWAQIVRRLASSCLVSASGAGLIAAFGVHWALGTVMCLTAAAITTAVLYPVWLRWWLTQHAALEQTRTDHLRVKLTNRAERARLRTLYDDPPRREFHPAANRAGEHHRDLRA